MTTQTPTPRTRLRARRMVPLGVELPLSTRARHRLDVYLSLAVLAIFVVGFLAASAMFPGGVIR